MNRSDPPLLAQGDALLLDFDGTLTEIVARPDLVRVDASLVRCLHTLQHILEGALAVVTGRRLADIDRLLLPLVPYGAGLHGAELRTPTGVRLAEYPVEALREAVAALHAEFGGVAGVQIEDKGPSVALHFRNAADREADCARAMAALAFRLRLTLLRGKMVLELRGARVHKGDAVRELMQLAPFHGRRPVFAGDDVTDEDAFGAVATLGGITVKIGQERSRADYRLADVPAVHDWLTASQASLEARAPLRATAP